MKEPVTLHVRMFIQGHHTNHSTEFVLTSEGGSPDRPEDVISRIIYAGMMTPEHDDPEFARSVATDTNTVLKSTGTIHAPKGWIDHVSYNGYREVSDLNE